MTIHDCDGMRELLPLLAGGRLDDVRTRAVTDHLLACASCAQELAVLRGVAALRPEAPAGLETRIGAALRQAPARGRFPDRFMALRRAPLAAAATFAVALLGGALLYERMGGADTERGEPALDATLVWAGGADDPLVQGAATLAELTDEELETLLAELDL
jgi:hypothetical protein